MSKFTVLRRVCSWCQTNLDKPCVIPFTGEKEKILYGVCEECRAIIKRETEDSPVTFCVR